MRYYILNLIFFLPITVYCQSAITSVSLLILDKESNSCITYAHIVIKGKNIGTISNDEGRAEFKIDRKYSNDTLIVSAIGFISQEVLINQMISNYLNEIRLDKQVYSINQVTISTLKSKSIVELAIRNILNNYPIEDHYYSGFFRTAFKENDDFVRYLEASVGVFDKGFHKRRGLYAKINQLRKSNDYRQNKWKEGNNYLSDCLYNDPIRFREEILNIDYIEYWDFNIENILQLDSSIIFNISFCPKDTSKSKYEGTILIRKNDYAILQLNYSINYYNKTIYPNDYYKFTHINTVIYIRYKDFEDKMIKSYQSLKQYWNVLDLNDKHHGSFALYEEFITHDFGYGRNVGRVSHLRKSIDIYKLGLKYDKNFWNDFNIPVDNKLFKSAKDRLNTRTDIEKQFEQNSNR